MAINIPNQQSRQWKQGNDSDLMGNISVTKNITFDNKGYLRLSGSPRAVIDQSTSNFNNPAVILPFDGSYFTQTWDSPFTINIRPLAEKPTAFTDSLGTVGGGIQSDAIWFGGKMPFSDENSVSYYDPTLSVGYRVVDTNITLTNTSQSQHPIVGMLSLAAIAVADVNSVKIYNNPLTATPVLANTLQILSDYMITGMVYFNQQLYVATKHNYSGKACLFVWNGQGNAAQQAYEVDSNIIFSICVHKDSVVILTGDGALLRYNGAGFTLLDAFPIYYTNRVLTDVTNIGLYKNIMKSNGDVIYILFNDQENNSKRESNQPDGVWCYDDNVGLYHKYSLSNSMVYTETIATSNVDTGTSIITVTSAPITGTEVYYRKGISLIGGLTNETKYFVIKLSATTIKLATTKANALAGTGITLTSTGSISQQLVFFPNYDFGQTYTERTMALGLITIPTPDSQYGYDLIWGGEVPQRTLTGSDGMLGSISVGVEARGYFITPKITSQNVLDKFNLVTLKFSPMQSELDKIIIKYRTVDDMKETINLANWAGTWTSATTFTSTATELADTSIGDEVEILKGAGGGMLAHITDISENAGTYTITIDESFENYTAGDKCKFVTRNWTKWKTISYADHNAEKGFISENIGATGKFIQLKIELRGVSVRVEELSIDNKYHLPSKQ